MAGIIVYDASQLYRWLKVRFTADYHVMHHPDRVDNMHDRRHVKVAAKSAA